LFINIFDYVRREAERDSLVSCHVYVSTYPISDKPNDAEPGRRGHRYMTDTTEPEYRTRHRSAAGATRLVDPTEGADEGMMRVRMPIASTGDVRNEGDDPLTRSELRGMAKQINRGNIGVFPDHGRNMDTSGAAYSQLEKFGYWSDAEVDDERAADGEDLLVATANMPDPETVPAATGKYRQALAVYKTQAEREVPMDASIGWRTDEDAPGGNDHMEVSIVGVGADPRTNTEQSAESGVVARAAVEAGADPDDLVRAVRDAVDTVHNLDDPAFAEGDAVTWSWDGTAVHGRVAGVHEEFTPPGADDPITGDDGEAVYSIHEWDEDVEAFREQNVAKPESSLSASEMDMPAASEDNFQNMSDDDPPESDPGDTTEEQTADDPDTDQSGEDEPTDRAPDDVSEDDLLTMVARHYEGMDESDFAEAADAADAEYVGAADVEAVADFVSVVTGAEYDAVIDAMDDLMEGERPNKPDDDEEEDGEEDDDESEQSAETDADDADDSERDLADEVDALRDELAAIRSGDANLESPDGGDDDSEAEERDADASDEDTDGDEPTRDAKPLGGIGDYR